MDYGSDSTESSVEADRPDSAPAGSSKVLCVRNDHQSVSDKLRYAASCGQVDQLRHLLTAGVASFESDAVCCKLLLFTDFIRTSCEQLRLFRLWASP